MKTETKTTKSPSKNHGESTIENISPAKLHDWMEQGEVLLIDVREPLEHARESIPGSERISMDALTASNRIQSTEKTLVVHCNTGNRSSEACNLLTRNHDETIYNLDGGLQAWKDAGYETDFNEKAPIGIQRQVQIAAGSGVLLGIAGSYFTPWMLGLSAFIGAGLVYAGVSGTCGMAIVLSKMPWNQSAAVECTVE